MAGKNTFPMVYSATSVEGGRLGAMGEPRVCAVAGAWTEMMRQCLPLKAFAART